jgi:RecA/RadA recombinase
MVAKVQCHSPRQPEAILCSDPIEEWGGSEPDEAEPKPEAGSRPTPDDDEEAEVLQWTAVQQQQRQQQRQPQQNPHQDPPLQLWAPRSHSPLDTRVPGRRSSTCIAGAQAEEQGNRAGSPGYPLPPPPASALPQAPTTLDWPSISIGSGVPINAASRKPTTRSSAFYGPTSNGIRTFAIDLGQPLPPSSSHQPVSVSQNQVFPPPPQLGVGSKSGSAPMAAGGREVVPPSRQIEQRFDAPATNSRKVALDGIAQKKEQAKKEEPLHPLLQSSADRDIFLLGPRPSSTAAVAGTSDGAKKGDDFFPAPGGGPRRVPSTNLTQRQDGRSSPQPSGNCKPPQPKYLPRKVRGVPSELIVRLETKGYRTVEQVVLCCAAAGPGVDEVGGSTSNKLVEAANGVKLHSKTTGATGGSISAPEPTLGALHYLSVDLDESLETCQRVVRAFSAHLLRQHFGDVSGYHAGGDGVGEEEDDQVLLEDCPDEDEDNLPLSLSCQDSNFLDQKLRHGGENEELLQCCSQFDSSRKVNSRAVKIETGFIAGRIPPPHEEKHPSDEGIGIALTPHATSHFGPLPVSKLLHPLSSTRAKNTDSLPTGSTQLDSLLLGGLPLGMIVEVVGSPGSGKTRLCQYWAMHSLLEYPTHSVILLDCDHTFSPITALTCCPDPNGEQKSSSSNNPSSATVSPTISPIWNKQVSPELESALQRLTVLDSIDTLDQLNSPSWRRTVELMCIRTHCKVLIVDSIAAAVSRSYGNLDLFRRSEAILNALSWLKRLAEAYGLLVLVTNHVYAGGVAAGGGGAAAGDGPKEDTTGTSNFRTGRHDTSSAGMNNGNLNGPGSWNSDTAVAALGTAFHHGVNIRLVIEEDWFHGRRQAFLRVAKSSISAPASFFFFPGDRVDSSVRIGTKR